METDVQKKFGNANYQTDEDTFIMGPHYLLSDHMAKRFSGYKKVLDVCTGAGFMSMAIARNAEKVITVELNKEHFEQAKANAKIADAGSNVIFILGDILDSKVLRKVGRIEGAFLDPDWAQAKDSKSVHTSKLSDMQPPAAALFKEIVKKTQNIAIRLPKEVDLDELKGFPMHEIEKIYLNDRFKFYCVYFGKLSKSNETTEFRAYEL